MANSIKMINEMKATAEPAPTVLRANVSLYARIIKLSVALEGPPCVNNQLLRVRRE